MKEQYYLVSQLPDISSEKSTLPITEKYYRDLCSRFMTGSSLEILNNLSLEPSKLPEKTGSSFLDTWYEHEPKANEADAKTNEKNGNGYERP